MGAHAGLLLKMMCVILGLHNVTCKCFSWGPTAYAKTEIFLFPDSLC